MNSMKVRFTDVSNLSNNLKNQMMNKYLFEIRSIKFKDNVNGVKIQRILHLILKLSICRCIKF